MLVKKMGLPQNALRDEVAVITGAGQGIGKELARALAWLGATVVIAEIAETGAYVERLIQRDGGAALFFQTDVGDEKSIHALAQKTLDSFGRVDILINNAIIYRPGSILESSISTWDQVYQVNVRGAVLAIQAFLPGMVQRKHGTVVTLTSQEGMPYAASYFASKSALQSLGLSLAAELGEDSGVSAFVFAPGMVDTPGGNRAFQAMAPRFGMSYNQFTAMGANPGYEGLMPAEDCAAGFAYTVVHSRDYHGQVADPFQPLARAGLLPRTLEIQSASHATDPLAPRRDSLSQAQVYGTIDTAREVEGILRTVSEEFNELDMFRKMYARRDFQRQSGMSIEDWLATIGELILRLEMMLQPLGTGEPGQLGAKSPWLAGNLGKLARYFQKTRQQAQGFIKEPEALSQALAALDYREKKVRSLLSALNESEE